jgi:DNA-binding transcriptional ArsR family regulator
MRRSDDRSRSPTSRRPRTGRPRPGPGAVIEDASRLSGLLSLLADPIRSRILSALDHVEELCVGDLALALGVSEDAASYGLRLLRTAGMVANRKVGRVVYYRLADEFPEPLLAHCMRQLITLTRAVGGDDTTDAGAATEEVQR